MFPQKNVAVKCNSFCQQNFFTKCLVVFCCALALLLPSCKDNNPVVAPVPEVKKQEVTITSISPNAARIGDTLTIHGRYFSEVTTNNIVVFVPDVQGIVLSSSITEIVVVVPIGAQNGKVKVRVGEQTAEAPQVMEIFQREVRITSFEPEEVAVRDFLTIHGDGFSSVYSENIIMIGDVRVPTSHATPTQLSCKIPEGCTTGFITVEVLGGQGKSSKAIYVLQDLLPKENCIVEVLGMRVKQRLKQFTYFENGDVEYKDTASWKDFSFAIDTRKHTDIDFTEGDTKRFRGNRYTFRNTRRMDGASSYDFIEIIINPVTHTIDSLSIIVSSSENSIGIVRNSGGGGKGIKIGAIKIPWTNEHTYEFLSDDLGNAISSVTWDSSYSSGRFPSPTYMGSSSVEEFVVTDSAKISIKFVD